MTCAPWDATAAGVVRLPSGRLVRGRGLRHGGVLGPAPQFGLYPLGSPPPDPGWDARWVHWRDMWLPADADDARDGIVELWRRAPSERVEVACAGGRGRTGTVLACLAVLDGVPAADAVGWVRSRYHPRAVETPWQRAFVRRSARHLLRGATPLPPGDGG